MTATPWTDPASGFAAFERLARARRSSLLIDREQPVPQELLARLCRLVYHAPNHKHTVPWQVATFTNDARRSLGECFAAELAASPSDVADDKLDKTRSKYLRAPAVIVVACRPDPEGNAVRHREDLAAVAAGVENLLLGAAAAGLASLWSSPPVVDAGQVCTLAGFEPGSELLAVIYTGWPSTQPKQQSPPDRPEPEIRWHDAASR